MNENQCNQVMRMHHWPTLPCLFTNAWKSFLFSTFFHKSEKSSVNETVKDATFFFQTQLKKWAIDATKKDGTIGHLINHSVQSANLQMKTFVVDKMQISHEPCLSRCIRPRSFNLAN